MSKYTLQNLIQSEGVAYHADNNLALIELSRKGISKKSLLDLSESSSISIRTMAKLLPVTDRTIQRYREDQKFSRDVSEHIILIAKVVEKAFDVLEDQPKVSEWLNTPLLALGKRTPLSLLDTSFGAQMVIDELGRLEYGVYS